MEKSIICDYWENGICRYMNESSKCKYAHGESEIKVVECMYGKDCYNVNCSFNHGISTFFEKTYEIPIFINKRKLKNKKKNKSLTVKSDPSHNGNPNNTKMEQKTNTINKKIDFEKDNNKIYVKSKAQNIDTVITINNKLKEEIKELNNEIKELNNKIKELKNNNTKNKVVDKIINNDKIMIKYKKYIKIYEIFMNNNYKTINMDEIKQYTKDNNIYKIKQRSEKIYKYYEQFKNGIIDKLYPVSTIFKMVF